MTHMKLTLHGFCCALLVSFCVSSGFGGEAILFTDEKHEGRSVSLASGMDVSYPRESTVYAVKGVAQNVKIFNVAAAGKTSWGRKLDTITSLANGRQQLFANSSDAVFKKTTVTIDSSKIIAESILKEAFGYKDTVTLSHVNTQTITMEKIEKTTGKTYDKEAMGYTVFFEAAIAGIPVYNGFHNVGIDADGNCSLLSYVPLDLANVKQVRRKAIDECMPMLLGAVFGQRGFTDKLMCKSVGFGYYIGARKDEQLLVVPSYKIVITNASTEAKTRSMTVYSDAERGELISIEAGR